MTTHCHYCGVSTDRIEQLEAQLARAMDMLADVGGETLDDRLTKYIGCYMALQAQLAKAEAVNNALERKWLDAEDHIKSVEAQFDACMKQLEAQFAANFATQRVSYL